MELDKIYCGDSRRMDKIDDNSVHLTVTSPPYFVGKKYEEYLKTFDNYLEMLKGVFKEVVRVTIPGGKIIVNLGDLAVGSHVNEGFPEELLIMPHVVDFLKDNQAYLYSRIIWEKDDPWANSPHVTFHKGVQHAEYRVLPAWEYIFVFRKGREVRRDKSSNDGRWIGKHTEWKEWVHGIWKMRSVQSNDFHEAMFPEELAKRCIKMYSFPGDVILDPFNGSGTTAMAAKMLGRHYLGYDMTPEYVVLAENKLKQIEIVVEASRYYDKTENDETKTDLFENVPVRLS
jgi:site-specific DNA-methyltransferase (adenine-specific)